VKCEFSTIVDVTIKLYYDEAPNENLRSPSKLHALMDKTMDQVLKDHTSAFMKEIIHLLV
jgi:hypothetical protein